LSSGSLIAAPLVDPLKVAVGALHFGIELFQESSILVLAKHRTILPNVQR
jgi:hypothetical protein